MRSDTRGKTNIIDPNDRTPFSDETGGQQTTDIFHFPPFFMHLIYDDLVTYYFPFGVSFSSFLSGQRHIFCPFAHF